MRGTSTTWVRHHWHYLLAALAVSAYIVPCIRLGLGSLDGWGVLFSTNELVQRGVLRVSRPPGHPTVEFLILPALAKLLQVFGGTLGSQAYLVQLWLISTASIVLFMKLLDRVGVPARDALLAAAILALAPPFIEQAVNGEETTWALAFQLGAWLALLQPRESSDHAPSKARLASAAALLALAVGARPEVGIVGLPMALFILRFARRPMLDVAVFGAVFAMSLCLLWIPVIMAHSSLAPFPLTSDWRTKLAGAGYKHLFLVLPFPASVLLWAGFLVADYRVLRRQSDRWTQGVVAIFSIIPVMFAVMFVRYPTKTSYCLPCIVFILIVLAMAKARAWLIAGLACVVVALAVRVDLFRDRVFVGPTLTRGVIAAVLSEKPRQRLTRLQHAIALTREPKTVVFVRMSNNELDWLLSQGDITLTRFPLASAAPLSGYRSAPAASSFLVSVDAAPEVEWRRELPSQGYKFLIDVEWYRNIYAPYSIHKQAQVGDPVGIPFAGQDLQGVLF